MGANDQKPGPLETGTTPAAVPAQSAEEKAKEDAQKKETADNEKRGKDQKKEAEKAKKDIIGLLGGSIGLNLIQGMEAYGKFIMALEQLGAEGDFLKELAGFFDKDGNLVKELDKLTIQQIEAKLKVQLEGKLLTASQISTLKTNEKEILSSPAGETSGDYILRCLGLKRLYSTLPKRADGKENDPTKLSMIWLKLSGVKYAQSYSSIKEKLQADPETKKPILYENDLVYIETGNKTYIAGFVKDINIATNKVILSTVENGGLVVKEFDLKKAIMAFHLAGNTNIMPNSLKNLEADEKKDEKKPKTTGSTTSSAPAAAPGTTPGTAPAAAPAAGTTPGTAPAPAPAAAPPAGPQSTPPPPSSTPPSTPPTTTS